MKNLILAIASVAISLVSFSQELVTAQYDGFEDGVYTFSDADGTAYTFSSVPKNLIEKHKLKAKETIGKTFDVEYDVEVSFDEDVDDEYFIISLEVATEDDDDDDDDN